MRDVDPRMNVVINSSGVTGFDPHVKDDGVDPQEGPHLPNQQRKYRIRLKTPCNDVLNLYITYQLQLRHIELRNFP